MAKWRRGFSLLEVMVVVAVSAVLAAVAMSAVSTSVQRSRTKTAFEQFHVDVVALRRKARAEGITLRLCTAPACSRALALGVPDNGMLIEEVSSCAPATSFLPPRFRVLRYAGNTSAVPDGSADGVCLFPDGHFTDASGVPLDPGTWLGIHFYANMPPSSPDARVTTLVIDPATGALIDAQGAYAPLPFVDNLADRSAHGAPLP
jgi:prepilin-type N-terminal cleavage/methylation domain-containing protein